MNRLLREQPESSSYAGGRVLWKPRRAWGRAVVLLVVIAMLVTAIPQTANADDGPPRVEPQLLHQANARPDDTFRVIVAGVPNDVAAEKHVAAKGNKKIKEVTATGFVAEVRGKDIVDLSRQKGVKYVAPDARMRRTEVDSSRLATLYPLVINASELWPTDGKPGLTGAGIGVAVLDTGINSALPDFSASRPHASRVVASVRVNANATSATDSMGHGTYVAGVIAGNSWWSPDPAVRGKYIGVAPEANLINVKVSDDQGTTYVSDVINAVEWVIQNRQKYNIRAMNLSLISSVAESYLTSMLDAAVERAWFNGILVTVASGDLGPDSLYFPPANDPFVITVGAADTMGTVDRSDDGMAPWSSYGTSQDGVVKPDVVAPGRYIASTLASNTSYLARTFPDRIVDRNYIWMSGTSVSAPEVAGLVALALQAHPEWTNDQIKWLLVQTATQLRAIDPTTGASAPLPGQGAGEVDAARVARYQGTPGLANQGQKISLQLIGPGGATLYDSSADLSTSSWSTSSWSTSSWSTSSWTTSSWTTSSWTTSSWTSMFDGR